MSAHTEGPWTRGEGNGAGICVFSRAAGHNIACVYRGLGFPEDEAEANFALIAAAPDLLDALKSFVYEFGDKTNSATVNKARAAIAAATSHQAGVE